MYVQAIVAGYHENRVIRYDVPSRKITTRGIKEYDLAHNAVILDEPDKFKVAVFESHIGRPLVKLYLDSKLQSDLYLREIDMTKFSKLFNFEGRSGLVVGICGSTLTCMGTKGGLKLLKNSTIRNMDDSGQIQHVEILQNSYLIFCTQKAFYRITL